MCVVARAPRMRHTSSLEFPWRARRQEQHYTPMRASKLKILCIENINDEDDKILQKKYS